MSRTEDSADDSITKGKVRNKEGREASKKRREKKEKKG